MINLIPNQEKKKKVKDFYFRLTVVSIFVLGFCFLVASVALVPSYFLSAVKKNLADTKLETQTSQPLPLLDQKSAQILENLNNKLEIIDGAQKNKYLISEKVVSEILLNKMTDIKIINIVYETDGAKNKKISIRGIAPSRERLLLFRKSLEDDPAFAKVDLPISNFVKGSDIQFYLSLIPS